MQSTASAALSSWNVNWNTVAILVSVLLVYGRGWLHGTREPARFFSFAAGLSLIFIALASPLDTFDGIYLSAHMAQHLILMMLVPPLLLWGKPVFPLLRGLPKAFVREALAPFFVWPRLKRAAALLTAPPVTWLFFALNTIIWHLPFFYELALHSSNWHAAQHACFFWSGLLFWWPVLEPARHSVWPRWISIPYLLFGDLVNTGLSAFFVFSGKPLYPTYKSVDDQVLAGLIMWVPGSLIYLIPAFTLAMRVFSGQVQPSHPARRHRPQSRFFGSTSSWITFASRHRRWLQTAMLLLALLVMADGWFGRQIAPLNLAGTLPWLYWRALSVAALLIVGNLFCMSCPFVLVRDIGRRFLPAKWKWPHFLRNKWLAAALFVLYLWAYEAFSLWNSPALTAWIIAGYFLAALLIDGFFRDASFCKYVCPIGQFHFVTSLLSPGEIAVKKPQVCQSCSTFDCIKGNKAARGCELHLFQPKKLGNLDCTFCLDCVKACPHENVDLVTIAPVKTLLTDAYASSIGRLVNRLDWIALILVITFGAFVNAGIMSDPVMMWEHRWHARLGPNSLPWITAAVIMTGAVIVPGFLLLICARLKSARKFVLMLAPLGICMWAAHLAYHALGSWVADVTPLQILLLNAGLLMALYLIWRVAQNVSGSARSFSLAVPWAALALTLYVVGLWILFQPMQMRGTM